MTYVSVHLITWKILGDPGSALSEGITDNTVNLSWSPSPAVFNTSGSWKKGDLTEILLLRECSGHPSWPATEVRPWGWCTPTLDHIESSYRCSSSPRAACVIHYSPFLRNYIHLFSWCKWLQGCLPHPGYPQRRFSQSLNSPASFHSWRIICP